ncbi:hypothetical protein [Lewinella sp. IMCC34183]|uniref:hypothetical protein n=1 Tax=Lewinella sp. IMCC34183 TaxID=2248762 RepID=UPI000E25C407|nr:hypothetical protein [Lewinella sp. IMCC34183]
MYHEHVIYHVYNQSINYETIFKEESNYHYFLEKVKKHLVPVADVLAFCLMPDHFHFLLKPTPRGCQPSPCGRFLAADEDGTEVKYQQNLSHALKIMLSSYTRAINGQYRRRGSLFRIRTKKKPGYANFYPDAADLADDEPFTRFVPYLQICFLYIHDNPVKAGLVHDPLEWGWSSALDYAGWRDTGVCNFQATEHLLGIRRAADLSAPRATSYSDGPLHHNATALPHPPSF